MKNFFHKYGWVALTFFTFFFLLGSRSLNEPDEGRYAEIAREMVQTGDWLVPHLWYLPHLDKPPMTYWLVAASLKFFGQNEWTVRLPVALAGISGVIAAFLIGRSLGGRRVGVWSTLILQSSLLFFVMARFLTTDIFLAAFNAWAFYFFWESWLCLTGPKPKTQSAKFFLWHLGGWVFVALGFLTKGPIALMIPTVSFLALLVFRRHQIVKARLFTGLICGFILFLAVAAPWFLIVFHKVPDSANFMILGQAAGHFLGTTIKNRTGIFFYFFGILAVGLLPWTILLGWLWRKDHWRNFNDESKDGWLLLNAWAIFTFALFTFSYAKLPAYILPIFPALSVLLAWRFFADENMPRAATVIVLASAFLLPAVFPLILVFAFRDVLPFWLKWQMPAALVIIGLALWFHRNLKPREIVMSAFIFALLGFFIVIAEIPQFDTTLRRNQTLKSLGMALRENFQPGDVMVIWQRLPEGLPFYSGDVISPINRPYLGGMDWNEMPFRFPGNVERAKGFILPDDVALQKLLQGGGRVLIVSPSGLEEKFQALNGDTSLHLIAHAGQWELFSNR